MLTMMQPREEQRQVERRAGARLLPSHHSGGCDRYHPCCLFISGVCFAANSVEILLWMDGFD